MTGAVVVRLAAFAGALAVAFAGAFALGSAVEPVAAADPATHTPAPAGAITVDASGNQTIAPPAMMPTASPDHESTPHGH